MTGDDFVEMIGGPDHVKVDENTGERSWDFDAAKKARDDVELNVININQHTKVLAKCSPLHKFLFV